MNFASLTFWISLILAFSVLSILRIFCGKLPGFDRWAFVALSLFLLSMESVTTAMIFLWVAGAGFLGLRWRSPLWALVPLMLAPLFYYKYGGFFSEIVSGESSIARLLIPMGISFYTFQILSFVIDHRRSGQSKAPLVDYLNFASFFPQIVAGPIERKQDLLPQVRQLQFRLRRIDVESGLTWVILGLFFKLALAENFALLGKEFNFSSPNAIAVWLEAGFFACRIYFDFAGYSFIALGLARFFGIRLTLNFRSPYLARNLREFWRQWHVTLSRWFRDYVYIPLGGSRTKFWLLALLAVFAVSGLWHGAGWNFIIWGTLHGLGVAACFLMGKRSLPSILSWALTLGFVLITWIFFKEPDTQLAFAKIKTIADPRLYQLNLLALAPIRTWILAGIMMILVSLVFLGEWWSFKRKEECYAIFLNRWSQLILITAIAFLSPTSESSFIYFHF